MCRINLVSYSEPDTTLDLVEIPDSDPTDDRIIYTGTIPVYSKTHRETGQPGLGFKYQLYNRPNAQQIDIAITPIDGFLPDFNHFTLTRQIEGELWSQDIPNNWVIVVGQFIARCAKKCPDIFRFHYGLGLD